MRTFLDVFKGWLSLLALAVVLTGCGGGSGGTASTSISGTAATGAALAGTIELVDANGVVRSNQPILAGGAFTIDTTGLAAPFILRATGSGNDAGIILYSLADGVTGIFNITPLTHLALELLRQDDGAGAPADLTALFAAWNAQVDPTDLAGLQAALLQAQARINANLHQQFTDAGLTPANFDFLRTAFVPNQAGIDAVLDLISGLTIAGNTITMNVGNSPFPFNINIGIAGFNIGGGAGGGGTVTGGSASLTATGSSPSTGNGTLQITSVTVEDAGGTYTGVSNRVSATGTINGLPALIKVYYTIATGEVTNISYSWGGTAPQYTNIAFASCGADITPPCLGTATISGNTITLNVMHLMGSSLAMLSGTITSAGITVGGGTGGGGGAAAGSLTIQVAVSGFASPNLTITNVPAPSSQTEFCSDMTDTNSVTSLSNALGVVGTFTINSCSFNGSVGNVSATLAVAGVGSIPYTVVYTYN